MKKLCLLALVTLFAVFSVGAQDIKAVKGKVSEGYNFWFYTPEGANEETDSVGKPLIVFLHGASLCGNDLNKVKRYGTIDAIEKGRELDAFVIAPQNPGGSWNPRRIMNVVDYVVDNNYVDTDRIYVLGMSLGGYGSLDFAATYPDRIAAAIGICGGATVKDLSGLADMPLWIVHGTGDSAVPVTKSDNVVSAVKKAQGKGENRLFYDRVPGLNHSRPARMFYKKDTYDWLFKHSLSDPGRKAHQAPKVTNDYLDSAYKGLNLSRRKK